ncbi:carbon-nitrogen hydrolase family protein [Tsukamurella sp. 8F]|uniref:carbon-nitrogen hydrolase family protein n=1 Tax=unclassified Tsukamurella TaxID=2633480 RepID=UPI0023B9019E|nr:MULTISPECIES: carbon-nitrogen hydrolase family protein [unclassified Tsukamurella]MDF0528788.1 carbon-nitrogen hydrolase family protein [Tsukamurella sp. 8J]MDF0586623.1 carbon-nitrogen hydrolase family protein [Tsukamurella sp. 8F]
MPDALSVALLQGPQSHPGPPTVARNLAAIAEAARTARGADILVTPEMSVTGYDIGAAAADLAQPVDGSYHEAVARVAADNDLAIAYGYPERDCGRVYNTVTVVAPDGRVLASYRKTHLFGDIDRSRFAPGDELPVRFSYKGFPCGLLTCYDVEFPETVRAHADAGTELLLVPTGLMRPYDLIAEHVVPARAYESQLYIAYANRCGAEDSLEYCGLSVAVAADGEVLARAGREPELLSFTASRAALAESRRVNTHLADRRPDLYPRGDVR